jgi:hypothetical protein
MIPQPENGKNQKMAKIPKTGVIIRKRGSKIPPKMSKKPGFWGGPKKGVFLGNRALKIHRFTHLLDLREGSPRGYFPVLGVFSGFWGSIGKPLFFGISQKGGIFQDFGDTIQDRGDTQPGR